MSMSVCVYANLLLKTSLAIMTNFCILVFGDMRKTSASLHAWENMINESFFGHYKSKHFSGNEDWNIKLLNNSQ